MKNCLFGATNIVRNSYKERYVYSCQRIAFDGKGEGSFDKDYAKNYIIFSIDNGTSPHADNLNNNLILLGEGDTFGINRSFGAPEKKVSY